MKKCTILSVLLLPLICGSQNLIQNSSFEFNDSPTGEDWYSLENPIPLEYFENDAPEGGGQWSIKLNTWGRSLYYAETYLTNFSGQNILQLTGWMKTTGWYGVIALYKISSGQIVQEKIIMEEPTTWTKYEIIDTMNLQSQDTVLVKLSSTYSPIAKHYQFFDLIELRNLSDTLNIEHLKKNYSISVFPNPFHDQTQVILIGNFDKTLRFSLSSITGKTAIPMTYIEGDKFVLSRGILKDGIYILTIWDSINVIASKKVILTNFYHH